MRVLDFNEPRDTVEGMDAEKEGPLAVGGGDVCVVACEGKRFGDGDKVVGDAELHSCFVCGLSEIQFEWAWVRGIKGAAKNRKGIDEVFPEVLFLADSFKIVCERFIPVGEGETV